ncbi:MAG: hotdog fold thioesterase [Gammaproteobacteria bacterium]
MIWHHKPELNELNDRGLGNAVEHLGIIITEVQDNTLVATMPVDHRTRQPFGLLHGGASVLLAESVGSLAANFVVDPEKAYCVGMEINANHLKAVKSGLVTAKAIAIHLGKKTQVWEIKIYNENNQLICISRLTVAVIEK